MPTGEPPHTNGRTTSARSPQGSDSGGILHARYAALAACGHPDSGSSHVRDAGAAASDSSFMIASVHRLEQRLESERRSADRQLQRVERRIEELASELAAGGRWAELQGYVDGLAETVQELVRRSEEPPPATARGSGDDGVVSRRAIACLDARVGAVEGALAEVVAETGGSSRQTLDGQTLRGEADALAERFEEQLGSVQERLTELDERVQDAEHDLQDIVEDQDARHQSGQVGEQVMRLALRMQRLERGGPALASEDEARQLREELGHMGEQFVGLWARLQETERGMEGMAEGFGRVCDEVAELRERAHTASAGFAPHGRGNGADNTSDVVRGDTDRPVARGGAEQIHTTDGEVERLKYKVGEMERAIESTAEIVWDLRRQVSALRGQVAVLQGLGQTEAEETDRGQDTVPQTEDY